MLGRESRSATSTSGRGLPVRRARAALLLAFGAFAGGGLLAVVAEATAPPAFAATASLAPELRYIGDTVGTTYTFTVKNTGTSRNIGAVQIARPSAAWTIVACPSGPAGWSIEATATRCRYRSGGSTADDIKPGQTRTLTLKAKTAPGTNDVVGTWAVTVSMRNGFDADDDDDQPFKNATATGSGLSATLYTYEVTDAVVSATSKLPGTACPAPNKTAILGSTRTIVVCGKNHASSALTPAASRSTLGGTYIASPGTFLSGPIAANSANVVLADWNGTTIVGTYGTTYKVIAGIGSAVNRTSPIRTFTGYTADSQPPVAVDDVNSTNEDVTLNVPATGVLANDSDPESDPITAHLVTQAVNGTATVNANGSYSYVPNADFHGTDSFTYKANDGHSDSNAATVTITVNSVNDAPVAGDVSASTNEDTAKVVTLTATDVDAQPLTFSIVAGPGNGGLGAIGVPSCVGTTCTATVTYTPAANYNGPDSFTYKANDGTADSNVATVTLTVNAVNDAPVANPDSYSTNEDTSLNVAAPGVLGNDTDVEGSALTAILVTGPAHASSFTLNTDGSFDYTPTPNYNGPDSFSYKANDGTADSANAPVGVTINPVNDAPVASAVTDSTNEDTPKAITLSGTDVDGDALTFSIASGPAKGSLGLIGAPSCVAGSCTATVTYTPDANYNGPDSFTYKANDGTADSAPATVSLTVDAVNDAPVGNTDSYSTNEDVLLSVGAPGVLGNDTDTESTPLTASLVTGPSKASSFTLNSDGSFDYTPNANYNGPDSFTYQANDGTDLSAVTTVNITVNPVNDAPVASNVTDSTNEDTPKVVTLAASDVDGDALTFAIATGPAHGSLGAIDPPSCAGTVCTATVTYTPAADYNGPDSFTYTANDGTTGSNLATVSLTVNAVNDAPVANNDAYSTNEDTPLSVALPGVLGNDTDTESTPLTAILVTGPSKASSFTLNADGSFSYTPNANYNGSDSFAYKANDGSADSNVATVFLTVNAVNDAPTADAVSASTNEDTAKVVTLSGTDTVEGSALTFSIVTGPSKGSLGAIGAPSCTTGCTAPVTYTPAADYNGLDSFTYKVNDGTSDSAPATVSLTVNAVNDAPSFTKGADSQAVTSSGTKTVPGWATAISKGPADESGQTLTFTVLANDATLFTTQPAVDPATGDLTYTPGPTVGSTAVTVTLSDNGGVANGGVDTSPAQTFTITLNPPNATPTAASGSANATEDGGAVVVSLSGDDADGDALTFAIANPPSAGTLGTPTAPVCTNPSPPASHCTSTVTYTPAANFFGTDTFTYTVNDGTVASTQATITMTIASVNDAPSFTKGPDRTVLEDSGPVTFNPWATGISFGPANEAGQTVSFVVSNNNNPLFLTQPAVDGAGVLTFTPAANANGSATVTLHAHDDGGTAGGGVDDSAPQTFVINVTAVNDVPSFTKGGDQVVAEDAGAQSVSNWAGAISQGPANESAQTVNFEITNIANPSLFSAGVGQPAVSPTGTLTYTPAANQYGSSAVTLRIHDNGGIANGGVDTSATQTFLITVNPVNDAPVAAAHAYTVQSNMKISLGGLLVGATDPNDTPVPAGQPAYTPSFTVGSITVGAGCVGCTVSAVDVNAGTFDFDPPAGGTGSFTLTYTVVDSGYPGPGIASAPQTITFTVNGPVVWFVDSTLGAAGTGRLSAPFNTLGAATTAMGSTAGSRIFVDNGNVTGNVTLPTTGWLLGDGVTGASFDAVMGFTPPAGTIARPAINSGARRQVAGHVTTNTGSVLRSVAVAPPSGTAGVSGSGLGQTINDVTVAATTARAVDLSNADGTLSFVSVAATGATRGISLTNVNVASGTFTVVGTGSAGSGGTIAGSTAAGTAAFGTGDGGIYLNNAKNVSLDRMVVSGGAGNGVYGTGVTAFTMANSSVTNNGSNVALDHDGIHFDNLFGTSALTGLSVTGSKENNIRLVNNSGTAAITVSGSTIASNDASVGANGLFADSQGSAAMTVTVNNNTFTNNNTDGLALFGESSAPFVGNVGVNTFNGNQVGVDVESNGTGPATFVVNGVTVTGCATCGGPIVAYKGTGATGTGANAMSVTIANSTVTNGNSGNAPGIWVHGEGSGALRATIDGNNVRQVQQWGIYAGEGNGTGSLDVSIVNNDVDVSAAGAGALNGIYVESGTLSGDNNAVCGNVKTNKSIGGAGFTGVSVNNFFAGSFRLPGYAGTTDAQAASFLAGQNTPPTTAEANSSANPFTGGAACNTP
ncbi:MAG: large repetitive protein [Pseudonocardiales bacterium]|jgi:VCBS repeat-containing protein|nr:large repetitive protein [Pseudonocardiales bacterium]